MAYTLVGQPDHLSVHPGGTVITPGPLTDFVPVQWAPKGFLITQFEHGDVEAIGLPKIDLLGIRALTVLSDTAEAVRRSHPGFRLDAIPLDDPATSDILMRGDTIGVFQCESDGAQRTLRKLRAHTVRDLAIANVFFKPGPAMGGMADAFVRRYRGQEAVRYLHPALEPILRDTKGVLIFQEQVLRVARRSGRAGLGAGRSTPPWDGPLRRRRDGRVARAVRQRLPSIAARWSGPLIATSGYPLGAGHGLRRLWLQSGACHGLRRRELPLRLSEGALARGVPLRPPGRHGGFHHPAIYMAEAIGWALRSCRRM